MHWGSGPNLSVEEPVSMPLEIDRLWPQALVIRQVNAFELVGEQVLELARNSVVGDDQTVVVSQADEMTIEEPMACC